MRGVRFWAVGTMALALLVPAASRPQPPEYGPELVARTPPRSPEEERKGFHLPAGFEIQLVAAEPQIQKPINLAFDDRGRLWVTDTIEYPFPAKEGTAGRDTVKILEDLDGDGRADRVATFADGLNIPIGVLPVKDGAIVYSIPNLYHLVDRDGDGRADDRRVLLGPFGHADTHGMINALTWGFDGWVYACHGFANNSRIEGKDGQRVLMNSGNTFRFRPDGSRVEPYTWGQVNPFGLCFDARGDLFSADCHSKPLMMLLRGGYYQSFGKPHDGLGFAPEICKHSHNSTAIAGVVRYEADQFPPSYRGTVFIGNVVTNRINHDRLEAHGSTLQAVELPDFLTSDDPWFRPVDLKLGPDGALYVADFYNRIIGHYEVPLTHPGRDRDRGRIWRIVYKGPEAASPPRMPRRDWRKASGEELVGDLGHPNLAVRFRAANQLVERGEASLPLALKSAQSRSSVLAAVHALWVLERIRPVSDELLASRGSADNGPLVRVHVQRILSERKDWSPAQTRLARSGLVDSDPFVRRAAADAIGRHPDPAHLRPLLDALALASAGDLQLVHTLRMALRNQLVHERSWTVIAGLNLDQSDLARVADAALGSATPQAANFLLARLESQPLSPRAEDMVRHVARHGAPLATEHLLEWLSRGQATRRVGGQAVLFRAFHQGTQERGLPLSEGARAYAAGLISQLLGSADAGEVQAGIDLAGSTRLEAGLQGLAQIAEARHRPEGQRSAALGALAAIQPRDSTSRLGAILADASEPIGLREKCAQLLGGMNQPESQAELVRCLPTAPGRLQSTIAAGLAGNARGGELLLEAIAAGKASARLLRERPVTLRLAAARVPDLEERLARLTKDLPPAEARWQELVKSRQAGFAAHKSNRDRGRAVFEKHCAACHQIGEQGARIGPQLDGVGIRGLDRLLEDLIDPNRNVDQAFRSTTLLLRNGQVVSGLVLREEGDVLVLADSQGKEQRVPKKEVEERTTSQLSLMPANLIEQVPEADFYDLVAYLLSLRAK